MDRDVLVARGNDDAPGAVDDAGAPALDGHGDAADEAGHGTSVHSRRVEGVVEHGDDDGAVLVDGAPVRLADRGHAAAEVPGLAERRLDHRLAVRPQVAPPPRLPVLVAVGRRVPGPLGPRPRPRPEAALRGQLLGQAERGLDDLHDEGVRVLLAGPLEVDEALGDAALRQARQRRVGARRAGQRAGELPGLGEREQLVGLGVAALDAEDLPEAGAGGGEQEVGADGLGVLDRGCGVRLGAVEVAEHPHRHGPDAEQPRLVGLGAVAGEPLAGLLADLLEADGVGDAVAQCGAVERSEGADQPGTQVRRDIDHVDFFPGN